MRQTGSGAPRSSIATAPADQNRACRHQSVSATTPLQPSISSGFFPANHRAPQTIDCADAFYPADFDSHTTSESTHLYGSRFIQRHEGAPGMDASMILCNPALEEDPDDSGVH